MLTPPPKPEQFWVHPTPADIFNSGLINAGSFAINLQRSTEFLRFWETANLAPGTFYDGAGYQTDQQHLNWALVNVPGVCVLRSTRYNVAYWNLHERDLRTTAGAGLDPQFQVDHQPLGFFHFSGFDVHDPLRLSQHDGRHSVYDLPAIAEILSWYSNRVLSCSHSHRLYKAYRYDHLANGFRMTRFTRELLKKHDNAIPRFDSRTEVGANALCGFLMDPLPATGSMLPLVAAVIYDQRPDLQAAFPGGHISSSPSPYWYWFCRHAGKEFDIQFLIDHFRRMLVSNPLLAFANQLSTLLGEDHPHFLAGDRVGAAEALRLNGRHELADSLLEGRLEWFYFNDVSGALDLYIRREDLQTAFPDVLDADHAKFCDWLAVRGVQDHRCSPAASERMRRCRGSVSLARIFSFLARREDLAGSCRDHLLSENPEQLLRDLIRPAGDGLEYDLDDVVILRFVHQTCRHLLVPLYLELPATRRHHLASRTAKSSINLLPENVRDTDWARRGCELHSSYFGRFEARLDDEMRRWAGETHAPSHDVLNFLRTQQRGAAFYGLVLPAYQAAARNLGREERPRSDLWATVKEREQRPGVNVFGYFHSDIGIGKSTRGLAHAVSRVRPVNRVPMQTGQLRDGTELSQLLQRFDHLSDTNVFVSYPHQREDLLGLMQKEYLIGRKNIAHLAWEQKDGNPWWKTVYDRYDEIWTISEFAATPFKAMFPGRVRVVPNVLDFTEFPRCDQVEKDRLTEEIIKYLFVFDANSSMERKNPEGVIDAFIKAFKGTPDAGKVHLALKVGGLHRAEHAERVRRLRQTASASGLSIQFDGRQLPRADMLRLIAGADCYVSLHRSEGFGYTMAEAMSYGVPVIASGYSGNLEYMSAANSLLVSCRETFVKVADGPFQRGSIWGEPSIDDAASLLRSVAQDRSRALEIGKRGQQAVRATLSASAVAEIVRPCFEPSSKCKHVHAAE